MYWEGFMLYKKDWVVGWNDLYQIATLYVERIPAHLWLFGYIINIPKHILNHIPVFTLNYLIKPCYKKYKKEFFFIKRGHILCNRNGVKIGAIKLILKDIIHAIFYPIREFNLWLNSKRYRFGDWGEWFYWSNVKKYEDYVDKRIIKVEMPFSYSNARDFFPNEYEKHTQYIQDIYLNAFSDVKNNELKAYMEDSDNEYDNYCQMLRIDVIRAKLNMVLDLPHKAIIKSCGTCNRKKIIVMGNLSCSLLIDNKCGITDFPFWNEQ